MKRIHIMARFAAVLLLVTLTLSVTACSETGVLTPDSEGRYVNDQNGRVYLVAPGYYSVEGYDAEEPVALNDGISFYAVAGTENDDWLYSPDFGILLYGEGVALPSSLTELNPTKMDVCIEDGMRDTVFEIESAEKIAAVLNAYESGETLEYTGKRANYKFYLEFTSAEVPFLIYNLLFVQYAEDLIVYGKDENGADIETNYGKNFLYNRFNDRFVAIGDEMQEYIDEYYRNTDAE